MTLPQAKLVPIIIWLTIKTEIRFDENVCKGVKSKNIQKVYLEEIGITECCTQCKNEFSFRMFGNSLSNTSFNNCNITDNIIYSDGHYRVMSWHNNLPLIFLAENK